MTMQQFLQLTEMEQVATILQSGTLMTQQVHDDHRVFVYHLDSFYASAMYALNGDQLLGISCHWQGGQWMSGRRLRQIAVNPAERERFAPEL